MNLDEQRHICEHFHAECVPPSPEAKIGISLKVRDGVLPLNGLRHPPTADASGWYIWAGEELSTDPAFFAPMHAAHLQEWCPEIVKFLGLPAGWRFLKSGEYEDVWYDPTLLNV